jgi:PAS domain S-box-containing protein
VCRLTRPASPSSRRLAWPAWLALGIGFAITLLATLYARSEVQAIYHRELELTGFELAARVQDRLRAHAQVLRSGAAFFAGSSKVTRQEWQSFVAKSRLDLNLPGIQGVGFAQLISPQWLADHEWLIQAEGFPDYRVKPQGRRPVYSSIIFIEPFAGLNLRAFGFDMLSEPVLRAAMERARDRDEAVISGKVRLVQETDHDVQAGTVMFVPVYRVGQPVTTPAERQAVLLGWVFSSYRMNDLMQGILRGEDLLDSRHVRLTIFDGDQTGPETLLYDSQPLLPGNQEFGVSIYVVKVPVEFNGHRWTLQVSRSGSWGSTIFDSRVLAVAGSGAVISILLAALWWALIESRRRAVQLSDELAARQRAETVLRERESVLRAVLDNIPLEFWARDADGVCFMENPVLVRHWGSQLGTRPEDCAIAPDELALWKSNNERALAGEVVDEEVDYLVQGERRFFHNIVAPIQMGDEVHGILGLNIDITERKRAEQALLDSQADLNRAQAMGQIGSWRFDARGHRIMVSPEINRLFGIPEGTQAHFATFMAAVHPDDRVVVERQWQAARTAKTYDIEHRLMVKGRVKWVRAWAEFEFDELGELLSAFGAVQDISERHEVAEQLRAQLCLTQAITDCAAESIFVTDTEGRVTFMNPETERTFGWSERELRGRVMHEVIHHHHPDGSPFPYSECPNCEIRRNGEALRNTESVYFCKDGSTRTVATSSAPLEIAGQMRGVVFVVHDITEIKRAEASLRDADRRKDEFLAMLAHELRNPLVPIRNAAHILGLLNTGEPQVQWAQRIIEQQVTHLTRMVDDLLDVSRIVSGKIALKLEVIDLAEVVQQVVEMTRPLIDAKGHRLQLDLPTDPLRLRCDEVRLSQVLVNLIDNAVKYTPAEGLISLGARTQGEWIEVWVEDNGLGISTDLLPYVFDLFQQGERTLDRAQGGLGLGLTLVRSLVQAHGGRVSVESDGPGCGTRTRVWLPLYQGALTAPPGGPAAEANTVPLRILVVDDEEAVADSMAIMLRLDGNRVEVARSGVAAIQIAVDFRPDVVLLDIGMSGMNGYETAQALRAGTRGSELFLVAVTGYGDEQAQERAREAGFDRYLIKPVEPDQLVQLLGGLKTGGGGP